MKYTYEWALENWQKNHPDFWAVEGDGIRYNPERIILYKDGSWKQTRMVGDPDPVAMPSHYTQLPVECIDVTEHFGFCLGNAIKYIWRADHKGKPIEDLEKAAWYIRREIEKRKRA